MRAVRRAHSSSVGEADSISTISPIELGFQTAWPHVVECIEDDGMNKAHGKLSWYHDSYQDMVKNMKSLQEQLDSKKERRHKVESDLHDLWKEVKGKGKQKETSASTTHKWREWESAVDVFDETTNRKLW